MTSEETARLLIVDDERDVTESLCYMLRKQGYEIQTANHALEALEIAGRFVVDVMITDIRMPDMDGLELLREIRKLNQDTMVIAVSAHGSLDTAVEFMREGGVDFLQKPVSNDALRLAIRSAVEKWRLRRDLRLANEELRKAKGSAEKAFKARSEFLANMSHEIRTPLNAIVGLTHLLVDSALTVEQKDYVKTIQLSGEALLDIVTNILSMTKIESGRLELESIPFDLRACAETALNMMAPKSVEKGLELIYDVDPQVPYSVLGDMGRVHQILVNLLNNALKFTEQGEVILSIRMGECDKERCLIHFTVGDTGIGIDPDNMNRIFDSFKQADSSMTRKYGGTGLGLSICRELCGMMGGTLSVESQVGVGSRFHFQIAVKNVSEEKMPVAFSIPVTGHCVLLSVGNRALYEVMERVLEKWGMRVVGCRSEEELAKLTEAELSGVEVCIVDNTIVDLIPRWIDRLDERVAQGTCPFVYLTSLGAEKVDVEMDAWLVKPVPFWKLRATLVRLLVGAAAMENMEEDVESKTGVLDVPVNILLAEDNLVNQKVALKMLAKVGLKADLAVDGNEVIKQIQSKDYDIILMDVQMPGKDGLETTVEIRRMGKTVYIAGMTAHVLPEDRDNCIDVGMDDYIPKPVRPAFLYEALRKAQKTIQRRRQNAAETAG
ncbi:MAG: response regulator [Kiritimatiellae bacterium]|nr:response regulator [Kiritimatiellia bacterium]